MCGRYTLIRLADFTDMFPWIRPPEAPATPSRYNIAPTQPVAVVPNDGRNRVDFFHWGLVPSWAKDPSIGNRMINARVEGLSEKPAFRAALRRRRCLIPASGFYEWKKSPDGKSKTPMYIRMRDHKPFAFAGLWEVWHAPDGLSLRSCVILTCPPNKLLESIHDRMPVILDPDDYQRWLEPAELESDKLAPILRSYPAERMEAFAVGRGVNSPKNESASNIEPAGAAENEPASLAAEPKTARRGKNKDKPSEPRLFD
ncbi:MAG TPA: SOS response-associated peptidase [Tepidisphaeraceae bacterium]|jgi:putative SOS response-associated peptidase YedK